MFIHRDKKSVQLSVREFSAYQDYPSNLNYKSYKQTHLNLKKGRILHQEQQEQFSKNLPTNYKHEIQIDQILKVDNWEIQFKGRIDSIYEDEDTRTIHIIEIKSSSQDIPNSIDEIIKRYPSYIVQLSIYLLLIEKKVQYKNWNSSGYFQWVDKNSKKQKKIFFDLNPLDIFKEQWEKLKPFIENRWCRNQELRLIKIKEPFNNWRSGQKECLEALESAFFQNRCVCLEAPTGFGKTGLTLHLAQKAIYAGKVDRILYLTGKTTGQEAAMNALKSPKSDECAPRFIKIQSRESSDSERTDYPDDFSENWQNSGIIPYKLFENNTLDYNLLKEWSEKFELPKYEIIKSMLPYSEVWVADYNYLFSPTSKQFLDQIKNYQAENTFLIIDEAHNLSNRVELAYSSQISYGKIQDLLIEINRDSLFYFNLESSLQKLVEWIQSIIHYEVLSIQHEKDLLRLLQSVLHTEQFGQGLIHLGIDSQNTLQEISNFAELLEDDTIKKLLEYKKENLLVIQCFDASNKIYRQIKDFSYTLFMSATISPQEIFYKEAQIPTDTPWISAQSPWQLNAFNVAIDSRVDTRFKARPNSISMTAETIIQSIEITQERVLVFFPSFQYAQKTLQTLKQIHPWCSIALQPRFKRDKGDFIEDSIQYAQAIFLIMGSSYSESIDNLGEWINTAIIVSPSLPELNPVLDAKKETYGTDGFYKAYQIPAIRKINQAIGRLVRKPGDKAKILLHCHRFTQNDYLKNLSSYCTPNLIIKNEIQLQDWLNS